MANWLERLSLLLALAAGALSATGQTASATTTCQSIAKSVSSSSSVIYATSLNWANDIDHWFLSSTQVPSCVLEAGAAQDVSIALKIIAANKTPFAVKSGGHTSNPGFSSTTGVHIVFKGDLKSVSVGRDGTVEIGAGMTWSNVYATLQSHNITVPGGRVPGPGVGGFSLGGGYSWTTNQHGLTCDSVIAYNLVLPNSTTVRVDASRPDLFFALKGSLNRFGIVTSVIFRSYSIAPVIYGGLSVYGPGTTPQVLKATQQFYDTNTDPKAQIITTVNAAAAGTTTDVLFFYEGSRRPASFAPFKSIPSLLDDTKSQTYSSFVSSIPDPADNARGTFNSISTSKLTSGFLAAVYNETRFYGTTMALHGATTVSYDIEPFLKYGKFATESAYPHADSPLPLNIYFAWVGAANDKYWYDAIRASAQRLRDVAVAEGIYPAGSTSYPNYSVTGTSPQALYGAANAARLAALRKQIDPHNFMELAGGFSI